MLLPVSKSIVATPELKSTLIRYQHKFSGLENGLKLDFCMELGKWGKMP